MKRQVAKAVGYSLLSPLIVGIVLGGYYALLSGQSKILFQVLMTAVANAHIVGLSMAIFVLPAYMALLRYNKVSYSAVLTAGMLGGAVFSFLFVASSGMVFIINAVMAGLGGGLFLFSLRRNAQRA
ncbi:MULTISPECIES: hypothetical protein [Pseudoalteromonas]|uniref:Uncharacterized protein n=1 Tax=Pseudoalteromonas rubra TaxID=43658 RepID=A0A5S3V3A6_9GAMM|nr:MULTISPECIES: hypothetical protein [Pseudoalteromonas]MCG7561527.1 hypothetical protein [Pseudoalteromonas sp. McH1-42]QPB85129.1 hypothetical protein CWC22_008960 [Pseudoalteromonas rubra]